MSKKFKNKLKSFSPYFVNKSIYHNYHLGMYLANKYYHDLNTMINVGVAHSKFLINLSSLYKHIIGFEPDDTFYEIKKDIEQYKNIECYNLALSNKAETRIFYKTDDPTLNNTNKNLNCDTCLVNTITLDEFLSNKDTKKIDYLKIDAEWEDPNIILGSLNTIIKNLPIIQIETIDTASRLELVKIGYKKYNFNLPNKDTFFVHQSLL